jgi:thiamine-phosphate pyrophosphorylase
MLLCAITDGKRPANLVDQAVNWSEKGVDFIQLREKDLDPAQFASLAREILGTIDRSKSKILLNVPSAKSAGPALETGADGVHLAGKPVPGAAAAVRREFPRAIISVPCHDLDEVKTAITERVGLILFSPVFEKVAAPPQGLAALARACRAAQGIPVLALGGVTVANAPDCLSAGAVGVAGIRLFAGAEWPILSMAKPRYIVE